MYWEHPFPVHALRQMFNKGIRRLSYRDTPGFVAKNLRVAVAFSGI